MSRLPPQQYDPADLALMRIADQLDKWASSSMAGGWSTHQVKPMRELARDIRASLVADRYDEILPENRR